MRMCLLFVCPDAAEMKNGQRKGRKVFDFSGIYGILGPGSIYAGSNHAGRPWTRSRPCGLVPFHLEVYWGQGLYMPGQTMWGDPGPGAVPAVWFPFTLRYTGARACICRVKPCGETLDLEPSLRSGSLSPSLMMKV